MRFLLLFVLAMAGTLTLSGQYHKGDWYLDANSGINYSLTESFLEDEMNFRIKGGYFLRDRLLVGTEIRAGQFNGDGFSDDFRATPFVRYYLPNRKGSRLSYFGEAGLNMSTRRRFAANASLAIGAEYQLVPGLLLSAELRHDFAGGRSTQQGSSLNIGTNYIFGKGADQRSPNNYFHNKGDFMLSANLGSLTLDGRYDLSGTMNFSGGYFLSDNLLLTGDLGFGVSTFDLGIAAAPRLYKFTDAHVATGLRYQFNNGRRFQPYLAAGLRYDYASTIYERAENGATVTSNTISRSLSTDLKAGFLYHLNRKVALDFNVSYQNTISGSKGFFDNRVGAELGLKVFLGKRK